MNYASITRRFLAMFLDAMILIIPFWIASHILPFIGGLVLLFFYHPVFESSRLQATPGKHLMGIQVATFEGGRLSISNASLRLVVKCLSALCLFLGHFFVFFTQRRQALHDIVAQSVVLYGRAEGSIADAWAEEVRSVFK